MLKRLAGLTLAASLALLGSPAAAAEVTTTDPADAAAGWLARQMVDGERFESEWEGVIYFDYGLTIDTVWALTAAGAGSGNVDKAMTWLKKPAIHGDYTFSHGNAGGVAKVILAAQAHGDDPASFGGTDLPAKLLELMGDTGRFKDKGTDYHNVFKQALAVLALDRTPAGAPEKAVTFLASLQCDGGGFPLYFDTPTCTPEVDATALVLQALLATGQDDAAAKAVTWLIAQQKEAGGFGGSGSNGKENANSTGLAVVALRGAGKNTEADKGKAYLLTLQVGCSGEVANRGAFAYDGSGFDPFTANRSTAASIMGVTGVGLADLGKTPGSADLPVLKCETASPAPGAGGSLPVTGPQIWVIAAVGMLLVLGGAGTVVAARRRA